MAIAPQFVMIAAQKPIPSGMMRTAICGRLAGDDVTTHAAAVEWLQAEAGLGSYAITASLVCRNVPFETPTPCVLMLTLMPTGDARTAIYLRQVSRIEVISSENPLFEAFNRMLKGYTSEAIIGFNWAPLELV